MAESHLRRRRSVTVVLLRYIALGANFRRVFLRQRGNVSLTGLLLLVAGLLVAMGTLQVKPWPPTGGSMDSDSDSDGGSSLLLQVGLFRNTTAVVTTVDDHVKAHHPDSDGPTSDGVWRLRTGSSPSRSAPLAFLHQILPATAPVERPQAVLRGVPAVQLGATCQKTPCHWPSVILTLSAGERRPAGRPWRLWGTASLQQLSRLRSPVRLLPLAQSQLLQPVPPTLPLFPLSLCRWRRPLSLSLMPSGALSATPRPPLPLLGPRGPTQGAPLPGWPPMLGPSGPSRRRS